MQQELIRAQIKAVARLMPAVLLILFGIFALLRQPLIDTAFGLVLGGGYAVLWFSLVCKSAVRAVLLPPPQAVRYMRRSYALRYGLSALVLALAIYCGSLTFFFAFALPLLSPRLILSLSALLEQKKAQK